MKAKQSVRWIIKARRIVICWFLVGMMGGAFWSGEWLAARFGGSASSQSQVLPMPNVEMGALFAATR